MGMISACSSVMGIYDFPVDDYYEVDIANRVCARREIINKDSFIAVPQEELGLTKCDGVVGFKYDDFAKVRRWILRVNEAKAK